MKKIIFVYLAACIVFAQGHAFALGNFPTCPPRYTYDASQSLCTGDPICPAGMYYNRQEKLCVGVAGCPDGTRYSAISNRCEAPLTTQKYCSTDSVYDSVLDLCVSSRVPCEANFVWDARLEACVAEPNIFFSCPSGTSYDADRRTCYAQATVCASEATYNPEQNRCEGVPTCGPGTYDSVLGKCVAQAR